MHFFFFLTHWITQAYPFAPSTFVSSYCVFANLYIGSWHAQCNNWRNCRRQTVTGKPLHIRQVRSLFTASKRDRPPVHSRHAIPDAIRTAQTGQARVAVGTPKHNQMQKSDSAIPGKWCNVPGFCPSSLAFLKSFRACNIFPTVFSPSTWSTGKLARRQGSGPRLWEHRKKTMYCHCGKGGKVPVSFPTCLTARVSLLSVSTARHVHLEYVLD